MEKVKIIGLYCILIIAMIALIPAIASDVLLTLVYIVFSIGLLYFKSEKNDILAFVLGLVGITISEWFFVNTGVETFVRDSLFGVMPLWLPFLWAYAFVTIKRCLKVLDR